MARTPDKHSIKITSVEQLLRLISDLHEKRIRREFAEGPEARLRASMIATYRRRLLGGRFSYSMVSVVGGGSSENVRQQRIKLIGLDDETELTEEVLAGLSDEVVVWIAIDGVTCKESATLKEDLDNLTQMFEREACAKKLKPDDVQRLLESSPELFEGIVDRMMPRTSSGR